MSEALRDFFDSVEFFLFLYGLVMCFIVDELAWARVRRTIAVGVVVGCAASYLISFLPYYESTYYIMKYIMALAVTFLFVLLSFRVTWDKALFYLICGTAAEYFATSIFWLLYSGLTLLGVQPELESWWFVLAEALIIYAVCVCLCVLYKEYP